MPHRRRIAVLWFAFCVSAAAGFGAEPATDIERGDAAWRERAQGHQGGIAASGPIHRALDAYQAALQAEPRNLEARWKLARALYFVGDHTELDREGRMEVFGRGRDLGEAGLDQLAERLGGRTALDKMEPDEVARRLAGEPDAAPIYFWTAVHWGLWGRARGKIAAARAGVAGTIRDYSLNVIALDDRYDDAGGYRLLGRLHTEAPRIPLITGWVSRKTAVETLRRAVEIAPQDAGNRFYLAEAMIEAGGELRAGGLELLREVVDSEPRPVKLVEESKVLQDARELLARW